MHSLLLLATYVASALAIVEPSSALAKRQSPSQCTDPSTQDPCVFEITVGDASGSLKYFPEDPPTLKPGTIVQFNFMPKNHTVTESSFAEPCKPMAANLTSETRPGVRTGFVPVTGTEDFVKAFRIRVNDTKPMWLYCGQGKHCQSGMVMVINQNKNDTTEKTLAKYREKAAQAPVNGAPPAAAPAPSASAVTPVSPPPEASGTDSTGPALASSSTSAAPSPLISVFNGGAASAHKNAQLSMIAGLAVAGVFAFL